MATKVIALTPTQYVHPLQREKRTRRDTAYVIHDVKSNTVLLTQKLHHAVDFINDHLATVGREKVTVSGLYEAADTFDNRVDGCHKMRYRIQSSALNKAHSVFNQARSGIRGEAMILTASPDSYVVATKPSGVQ